MHREVLDAREERAAEVRPNPVAIFAEKKLPAIAQADPTADTSSIRPPTRRIARWSPLTMPWSTMSDMRRGRRRKPIDCASANTMTSAT